MKRALFLAEIAAWDATRLVFIDETGSHIAMTRDYGRAPSGIRVYDKVPRNRGCVTTMIGALTVEGVEALMTIEGGTSADVFSLFVREHLLPILRRGDLVVMDNLGAHHATGIREMIERAGANVLYMPPYSPDLNPIELCWSKLKQILKSLGARTVPKLRQAIAQAIARITPEDAWAWFSHCGHANQLN